jgi:hypothetical protein
MKNKAAAINTEKMYFVQYNHMEGENKTLYLHEYAQN